jgi:gliding motility-associated protein GldM
MHYLKYNWRGPPPFPKKKYKPLILNNMAGGKMNARQKMINMMYLVLTAILALNVASEVLNAFVVINMGLLQQNKSLDSKNESVITDFSNQRTLDSSNSRIKFLNEQALYIKNISDELSNEIENMKIDMVMKVDKVDKTKALDLVTNPMKVNRKDDYDGPTHYFGTSNPPGTTGKAHDLKLKLNDFYKKCMVVVDKVIEKAENKKELRLEIENKLKIITTPDPEGNKEYPTWEMEYFYHLPLAAALTELTKWQNFVKGAEGDMLAFLWNDISRFVFKFDEVKVAVIPKSNFITSGSNFEADIFLAAYSTNGSNLPTIVYGSSVDTGTMKVGGGATLEKDKFVNGVGKVSFPVSGMGEKTFAGTLQLKDPSGNLKTLPFSTTYNVAPPSASIAPTQLKVVYYGVDNPFSISVPGVAPNQLTVTASNASVTGSNGNYTINPSTTTGKITIYVSARMADGTVKRMGTEEFRIKRIPNPEIMVAQKPTGSAVNKNTFAISPIVPDMSGFLFPVYATVISVKGAVKVGSGDLQSFSFNGNVFPLNVQKMIKDAPNNSKLYLDEIKVSAPGGNRTLSAIYTLTNY